MERHIFLNLLDRYIEGSTTPQEQSLLEEYYKRLDTRSDLELSVQEEETVRLAMLQNIQARLSVQEPAVPLISKRSFKLWYAAASILLMLSVGGYFYLNQAKPVNKIAKTTVSDITPGSNKAILTLSNGKQLILTNAANGLLASQGATKIIKKSNGQIVYNAPGPAIQSITAPAYNTISVPRGGQYQIVLPDGSKVLLNAASSLTYPTTFTGNTRHVELKGEAYFEVAKNKEKPFIVKANDAEIKVLGTHFNVSAYADDAAITATLLEGAVRMSKGDISKLLNPGQQGITLNNQTGIALKNANVEQVMAWANGNFVFNDVSIKEVMKIAARWYDIEVEYHGNVQVKKFGGTTSRYKNLTELLDNMSETGRIHYKIEGRKVILMN
ncbi:FecR family protein [Mucilaginibacter sp.]|jgi:hypothetical protein|uniref:FecR family protein n=1 Tax=Mucilaginibacter sp. TaxID=1882438 RepID=UPI003563D2E9